MHLLDEGLRARGGVVSGFLFRFSFCFSCHYLVFWLEENHLSGIESGMREVFGSGNQCYSLEFPMYYDEYWG